MALNLKEQDLMKYQLPFRLYVVARGISGKLQAGNYYLRGGMTVQEIANKFFRGDVAKQKFIILEGQNLQDIGNNLESQKVLSSKIFFDIAGEHKEKLDASTARTIAKLAKEFEFLNDKPKDKNLEGYIFPDTYEIIQGENAKDMTKRILDNLDKKFIF